MPTAGSETDFNVWNICFNSVISASRNLSWSWKHTTYVAIKHTFNAYWCTVNCFHNLYRFSPKQWFQSISTGFEECLCRAPFIETFSNKITEISVYNVRNCCLLQSFVATLNTENYMKRCIKNSIIMVKRWKFRVRLLKPFGKTAIFSNVYDSVNVSI